MRSPSFVSGTTVWAATLCSGVEISPFGDARDPRAGDAYPQRLPPHRTPGAPQLGLPPLRPYPARSSAPTRPAAPAPRPAAPLRPEAQLRPGPQIRPCWRHAPRRAPPRPGHGNISSRCVPKLSAVARYRPDAFTKGPRTRKKPVRGNILPACIQIQLILARYACHVSKKPRKVPLGNTPREHLAAKGRFRRPKPSNHARRTNLAITFHPPYLPALRQCSPPRRSQRLPLCFCASFRSVASLRQCPVP